MYYNKLITNVIRLKSLVLSPDLYKFNSNWFTVLREKRTSFKSNADERERQTLSLWKSRGKKFMKS